MDSSIKLIIHRGSTIYGSVTITSDSVTPYEQKVANDADSNAEVKTRRIGFLCLNKGGYNAYLVSAYIVAMMQMDEFRKAALQTLLHFLEKSMNNQSINTILIRLRTPKKQVLDSQWSDRITVMALERREIDNAMSWLSTLGGAFSALGEEFDHCAEMAGKISVRQFQLALQLRDPLLVARCKLYAALSMIQRNEFRIPKRVVRSVYELAIEQKDTRLENMCHGIWSKLKYCYLQWKEQKRKGKL